MLADCCRRCLAVVVALAAAAAPPAAAAAAAAAAASAAFTCSNGEVASGVGRTVVALVGSDGPLWVQLRIRAVSKVS